MKTTQNKEHLCEFTSNDNKKEVYHRCTATELKEELCEKCPLPEDINERIQNQIIPQIRVQKSLLTKEQFNDWISCSHTTANKIKHDSRLKGCYSQAGKKIVFDVDKVLKALGRV